MTSNAWAPAAPERPSESGFDRRAAVTRSLLGYGVVAGPFYLAVGLIQALVRDGFVLARHPLSLLANGAWGWVQTANFVVSGLMVVAAAVGFRRVLGARSGGVIGLLGAFGVSMLVAAVLRADPADGFPIGTPAGFPTVISPMGMGHFIAGSLGFTALGVSCFFGAAVMARRGVSALARFSVFCGLSVLVGFYGGIASNFLPGTLGIWFSVVVGWVWIAVMSVHLYRVAPSPNCES